MHAQITACTACTSDLSKRVAGNTSVACGSMCAPISAVRLAARAHLQLLAVTHHIYTAIAWHDVGQHIDEGPRRAVHRGALSQRQGDMQGCVATQPVGHSCRNTHAHCEAGGGSGGRITQTALMCFRCEQGMSWHVLGLIVSGIAGATCTACMPTQAMHVPPA